MEKPSWELPMELVSEVLARLPVKSLVRFRCVCKAWCSLISSPDFASLHLARCHNDHDNALFLGGTITGDGKFQWMLLSSRTFEKITSDDYDILNNKNIMYHLHNCFPQGSSINGLLLLRKELDVPLDDRCRRELMLWNPMLGKTHKIPSDCIGPKAYFGLGFSSSSNDYKVVAINVTEQNTLVQVYNLSTRTWRNIVEYRENIIRGMHSDGYLLVEGVMNFLSNSFMEQSSHMVLFDVNDEVFTYIELPCEAFVSYAVVYREKVGLLDFDRRKCCCNLWVMEKNWVPESWRKLYRLDIHASSIPPLMLCFKENGEFLLTNMMGEVKLYDVESGRVKSIRENLPRLMLHCTPYRESLLLL